MGSVVLGIVVVLVACWFLIAAFFPDRLPERQRTAVGVLPAAALPMSLFGIACGLLLVGDGRVGADEGPHAWGSVLVVVILVSLLLAGWLHVVGRPRFLLPRQAAPDEDTPVPQTVVLHSADGTVRGEWPLSETSLRDPMLQVGRTSGSRLLVHGPTQS